jgi:hypothetical protein
LWRLMSKEHFWAFWRASVHRFGVIFSFGFCESRPLKVLCASSVFTNFFLKTVTLTRLDLEKPRNFKLLRFSGVELDLTKISGWTDVGITLWCGVWFDGIRKIN